jgi:hypothetical protein
MRIHKMSATIKVEINIILHFINLNPRYLAQNIVLRKIFGPKTGKVTGYCMRLHNDQLRDLYCSLNIE